MALSWEHWDGPGLREDGAGRTGDGPGLREDGAGLTGDGPGLREDACCWLVETNGFPLPALMETSGFPGSVSNFVFEASFE